MKAVYTILFLIFCVAVGAVSDGLNDDGAKRAGHVLGALEVGLLISGAFLFDLRRRDWVAFLVIYVCWRIVGFDYAYNLTRGLPILYLGESSFWDSFFSKQLPAGVTFARIIFLSLGVCLPFKYLKSWR